MRLIIAGQEIALVSISSKKDAPEDIFKITFWINPVQRAAFRNREFPLIQWLAANSDV